DVDFYHITFESDYSSTFDTITGDTIYFLNGKPVTRGVEAESTILVGGGVAVYLNATKGSARYVDSQLWVQNAPADTETIGATYNRGRWNLGLFSKRVGRMFNDNGNNHQAVAIEPFDLTNLFFNYTLHGSSRFSESRLRLAVNNLTDRHAITGVTPASTASNLPAAGDILTLMAGRRGSMSITLRVNGSRPPRKAALLPAC